MNLQKLFQVLKPEYFKTRIYGFFGILNILKNLHVKVNG